MTEIRKGEYRVPSNAVITQCRSCHADIIWTTTKGGKPIPLSVATVRVDEQGARWALNHFSDCPNARQHRGADRPTTAPPVERPRAPGGQVDLRDLPDYLNRHGLAAVRSTIRDDGNGRLIVELETRKA